MIILCDFDALERGVKTEKDNQAADDLSNGHTGVVLSGDKVFLKLNEFLRGELAYRVRVKPSVIGARLPFRNFPYCENYDASGDKGEKAPFCIRPNPSSC